MRAARLARFEPNSGVWASPTEMAPSPFYIPPPPPVQKPQPPAWSAEYEEKVGYVACKGKMQCPETASTCAPTSVASFATKYTASEDKMQCPETASTCAATSVASFATKYTASEVPTVVYTASEVPTGSEISTQRITNKTPKAQLVKASQMDPNLRRAQLLAAAKKKVATVMEDEARNFVRIRMLNYQTLKGAKTAKTAKNN